MSFSHSSRSLGISRRGWLLSSSAKSGGSSTRRGTSLFRLYTKALATLGLAAVQLSGKTIFIDKTGKRALPAEYEDANGFMEGLADVKIGDKWGFIDKTGKVVIAPQFEGVSSFFNGRASITRNKKYGYINKKGQIVVEPKYDYGHFFLGELAQVTLKGQGANKETTEYINTAGQVVWPRKSQTTP